MGQLSLKILYCFTSSQNEPFLSLQNAGANATWRLLLSPEDRSVAVYANASGSFNSLYKASLIFERLRWGRFGIYFTLVLRIIMKPFSRRLPNWKEGNGDLFVNIPEGLTFLGFKMLSSMDYAVKKQYDWLVITNLSSYPVCYEIREFLARLDPNQDIYAGKRLPSDVNSGISGSFVILSSATSKKILANKQFWDHSSLDDIALMKLTKKLGIQPIFVPSITLDFTENVRELASQLKKGTLHYKCGPVLKNGIRQDYLLMQMLSHVLRS